MLAVARADLPRGIGAKRHDLNSSLVQFGPKFLPSPQLGDAIRSPVAAKELEKNRSTRDARNRKLVAVLVRSREAP